MKPYETLESLSLSTGIGVSAIDTTGRRLYESSLYAADFLKMFHAVLDIGEADHVALLYGCYQSRRFGGRYIFIAPSGLTYCASPLTEENGEMSSGVLAGPFLLTDRDEFMEIDLSKFGLTNSGAARMIRDRLDTIPVLEPARARSVSELLYICAAYDPYGVAAHDPYGAAAHDSYGIAAHDPYGEYALTSRQQSGVYTAAYPIDKENDLMIAISQGDFRKAGEPLNDILGQILFQSGGDLEMLRSRVVELTVLLSRAALKGGANMDAIFGLNYNYLREIDALGTLDDIVEWLYGVTRRFAQHVFEYPRDRKDDVTARASVYIRMNYAGKISLRDVADQVYMSPTYFCKVFKDKTGRTPGAYIADVRIDESRKLLRNPGVNIADIPGLVGFESQSYFTRVFKKVEGCTPGRYRNNYYRDQPRNAV
jgi:AraC-like DNA-binding protein